jgi:hypothetical protein
MCTGRIAVGGYPTPDTDYADNSRIFTPIDRNVRQFS